MDELEQIAAILENGQCPLCDGELELIVIAGESSFLDEHPTEVEAFYSGTGAVRIEKWKKGVTEQGELRYKCSECGSSVSVFQTFSGDWVV